LEITINQNYWKELFKFHSKDISQNFIEFHHQVMTSSIQTIGILVAKMTPRTEVWEVCKSRGDVLNPGAANTPHKGNELKASRVQ
jgi:hypothetical protein